MEEQQLRELLAGLSLKEKIAQTVQLNGDIFADSGVMKTGPVKALGFAKDFDLYQIGSLYNVNDPEKLRELQREFLAKSRHKIPLLFMSDVIYGFRTIFPMPLAQAGSYDFELIQQAAAWTARESYLSGLHVLFSPMLDLARDARWGRVMESPGEDVYTAEQFARSVVKGYQGDVVAGETLAENRVAACIKHFAAYGAPEGGREYNTVDMSNQRLFNEYLVPYQAAIEAQAMLVMTAFNVLNGTPATGNRWLNRDILRQRFGFEGVLVSDHAAIEELTAHGFAADAAQAAAKALTAGVDMDMMTSVYANALADLVASGKLEVSLLDEAVWRILSLKNQLGLFENPYRGLECSDTGEVLTVEAKAIATRLVEESCVLLKNEAAVLPLQRQQKLAVIGPYGDSRLTLGFWASVSGKPQDSVSLREGLSQIVPEEQLSFGRGFNLFPSYAGFGPLQAEIEKLNGPIEEPAKLRAEALALAAAADVIVLTLGEQFLESGEGASKTQLGLPNQQLDLLKSLAELGKPIVGLLYSGRPLVLTEAEPYLSALLVVWYPGIMGGVGIANLLTGQAEPTAKLAMSFPRNEGQLPLYYAQNATGRPLTESGHSTRFVSKYIDESNEPLFSFGHGLSYTAVTVDDFNGAVAKEAIKLSCRLTNPSEHATATVVQVFIRGAAAEIVQPVRRLVASAFVRLDSQERQRVSWSLPKEVRRFYDNEGKAHYLTGPLSFCLAVSGIEKEIMLEI